MRGKTDKTSGIEPDPTDKRLYHKMQNGRAIRIRLTAGEQSVLEAMMNDEGWKNVSGFVRYKLFGLDPDKRLSEAIEMGVRKKEPDNIHIYLKALLEDNLAFGRYVIERCRKDADALEADGEPAGLTCRWASRLAAETVKLTERLDAIGRSYERIIGIKDGQLIHD